MKTGTCQAETEPEDSGFTLLEVTLVIMIIAMAIQGVNMTYSVMVPAYELKAMQARVVDHVRKLRRTALSTGLPQSLQLDTENNALVSSTGENLDLKDYSASVSTETRWAASNSQIVFFPNGRSTGGLISLSVESGETMLVRIDWVTGVISRYEDPPQP